MAKEGGHGAGQEGARGRVCVERWWASEGASVRAGWRGVRGPRRGAGEGKARRRGRQGEAQGKRAGA
eukprot:4512623-Prymnesium_polylepis.1